MAIAPTRVTSPSPDTKIVYEKLKISPLAPEFTQSRTITNALKALSESFCDKVAIARLTTELGKQGELRTAAKALISFAEICPNSTGELWTAANMLYSAGDYGAAIEINDKLIAQRPDVGIYYVMRGEMLIHQNRPSEAIENLSTALAFFENAKQANQKVHQLLASAYAADGQFCQAMTAIQAYVYTEPHARDTAAMRMLIADYAEKGKCDADYTEASAVIRRRNADVMLSKVTINGVIGTFIIDTGASFVTIDERFAKKANISLHNARKIRTYTANGVISAALTTAKKVELGKLSAAQVATSVISKPIGQGIDGLLGMSFLARFDVALNNREMRITTREPPTRSTTRPNAPTTDASAAN